MDSIKAHMKNNDVFRRVVQYFVIVIGSAIYAVGFQFFMYPNSIVAGGAVGVAMIINRLIPVPVGVMTIILNIPLFIVAWRYFGLDFLVSSLLLPIGSLIYLLFCVSRHGWGFDKYLAECNKGKGIKMSPKFKIYLRYVLPILILVILAAGLVPLFR